MLRPGMNFFSAVTLLATSTARATRSQQHNPLLRRRHDAALAMVLPAAASRLQQHSPQLRPPARHASSRIAACAATSAAEPGRKPYYVTTPIYYVNGEPHIGHAYTTLACDVLARFKRLDGHEVMFLTGTDEHGQKVEQSALAAGETPQAFADRVSASFRELAETYDFSCDQFIRTTEPRHFQAARALWSRLVEAGDIYLGSYEGWYAVRDECFYTEDELVEGRAPTGAPVEWVAESS
jgi:leucyl-tRNA synthetase